MEVKCLSTSWWLKDLWRAVEIVVLRTELLTEGIKPPIKMNSQQKKVNDYWLLSQAVIDLRLALLFMFIDAIVYLFGDRRHFTFSVWLDKIIQSLEPVLIWSQKVCATYRHRAASTHNQRQQNSDQNVVQIIQTLTIKKQNKTISRICLPTFGTQCYMMRHRTATSLMQFIITSRPNIIQNEDGLTKEHGPHFLGMFHLLKLNISKRLFYHFF